MPAPISGSLPAPKIIRMIMRIMISSGIPIPNIKTSSFKISE
jgi:hypothetical protein